MIKNLLAVIGILFCLAWAEKSYQKSELKQQTERFWEHVDTDGVRNLIDEVYND